MREAATLLVLAALLAYGGAFVYGWTIRGLDIPDVAWSALLSLIGTVLGFVWHAARKGSGKK